MNASDMSISELAGQRLMVGFEGTRFTEELRRLIVDCHVGGLILFSRNIETPDQVSELTGRCREIAAEEGQPEPFIAIDQEGGTVARLKPPYFTKSEGNSAITDSAKAKQFASVTARELHQVGVTMNFAPVMDVAEGTPDSIMKERSFPGPPETVASLGTHIINALQESGILAVAKHFPGIGRTTLDSHLHLPELHTPWNLLEESDLVPFRAAIDCGVSGIMLSHILYTDRDGVWPASLSSVIARDYLRHTLGYEGLVMTDDLDMKAIKVDIPTCVQRILMADIDLVLICHAGPNIDTAVSELARGINRNDVSRHSARACMERILKAKKSLSGAS